MAERVLGDPSATTAAAQLLTDLVDLLNVSVPNAWAVSRSSPGFVIRVTGAVSRQRALDDFLVVGSTYRDARDPSGGLYHLFDTVLTTDQLVTEGRRPVNEFLGVYMPEEFGPGIANRPNLYVFLGRPPARHYRVWARQQAYVRPLRAADFAASLGSKNLRTFYEIHELAPVTPIGLVPGLSRFVRLHFNGEASRASHVEPDFIPSYWAHFPQVRGRRLGLALRQAQRALPDEDLELERARKFRADTTALNRVRTQLDTMRGPGLRLDDVHVEVGSPGSRASSDRYFDTPGQDFRALRGLLRLRTAEDSTTMAVKLAVSTIMPAKLEWQAPLPSLPHSATDLDRLLRHGLKNCVDETGAWHEGTYYHQALRALADSITPLVEMVVLQRRSEAFPLIHESGAQCQIRPDDVSILRGGQSVGGFQEVEVEGLPRFPVALWMRLADHLRDSLALQEIHWSSKYERALSLLVSL